MILGGVGLLFAVLTILSLKIEDAEAKSICFTIFGLLSVLLLSMWNDDRKQKESIAFKTGGEHYRKLWMVRRRTIRSIVVLVVAAALAAGIVVGLHDSVRSGLYRNALGEYQRELEIQETKKKEYEEALEQYYIDARLAMGLGEDGWISAYITIDREFVDRWGSIGSSIRFDYIVNGKQVKSGDKARIQVFGENVIESQITEIDPSVNDVGLSIDYVFTSPQELQRGKLFSHTVTVSENRGRYSGNFLTMRMNYRIKAVERLNLAALDQLEKPEPPQLKLLLEPEIEDIPDSYFYTFSHNALGQLFLALFLTVLYKYYLYAWKRDERLLAEKIDEIEKEKRAEAWKMEQEQKRILEKQAAEMAREEERRMLQARRQEEEENRQDAIADAAYIYAKEKEKMRVILQEHTVEEISGVPKKVKFTDDFLPYDEGFPGKYGHFSVYVTADGKCYHAKKSCHGAWREVHLFKAIEEKKSPCSVCARRYPYFIPEWYQKYKDQLRKKEYYNL